MTGRRPKLTPQVQEQICRLVRMGVAFKDAAVNAGITERTFYLWKVRGEQATSGVYFQFLQELNGAYNAAKVTAILTVRSAFPEHWTAAAWWLERRFPGEFGKRSALTDPEGGATPIPLVAKLVFTKEDLELGIQHLIEAGELRLEPADEPGTSLDVLYPDQADP